MSFVLFLVSLMGVLPMAKAEKINFQPASCSEIQNAITARPKADLHIELKAQEYVCDTPIVINRDNVVLVGQGSLRTKIRSAPGLGMPVVVIGEPTTHNAYPVRSTYNVTVKGISVEGSVFTHPDPHNNECYDFTHLQHSSCENGQDSLVRNNGITIRAAHNVLVNDVETFGHISGGIVLEKNSSHVVIDGFRSFDNYYDGFAGYETFDCTVRNFELFNNQYSGISVDIKYENNTFEDGVIRDNLDNGIFSAQVGKNTYRRLSILNNKKYGFYFDGAHQKELNGSLTKVPNSCDDNVIEDTEVLGGLSGVYINHICQNTVLKNVAIVQANKNCVALYPGATLIQNNVLCMDKEN